MKYDWIKLKIEYISSDFASIKEFAEYKNIPIDTIKRNSKNWNKEKKQFSKMLTEKIMEKAVEKISETKSQEMVSTRKVASEILKKISDAVKELDRIIVKNKNKTKIVEYDDKYGKPIEEKIVENEDIQEKITILDRLGIKQLSSALRDLDEILKDDLQENQTQEIKIVIPDKVKEWGK